MSNTITEIDDLALQVHSAVLHMMRLIRRADDAAVLSAPRLSALAAIVFGGPRTLTELARMEQVSKPTMTATLAALEAQQFIRREASQEDRRSVFVHATAKGKRFALRGQRRRADFLAEKLKTLSEDELTALDRASRVMQRIFEESLTKPSP